MAYDVASCIKNLLFEHDSVIIPGFGGFVLNDQSASIDYIKSTISPPSKIPTFNKNLTLNDGVLVGFIKSQNACSIDEANQILENFITEINEKISKKEIVEFPQVGRIYKDYNKTLQFLAYDTNFNTAVFGLPEIEAHPFSRNEEVKTKAAAASTIAVKENIAADLSATTTTTLEAPAVATAAVAEKIVDPIEKAVNEQKDEKPGWASWTIPVLALASILIVAMSYFFLFKKDKKVADNADGNSTMTIVDDIKINEKPSTEEAEVTLLPGSDENGEEENSEEDFTNDNSDSAFEDEGEDSAFSSNECIVIVGQFSVKSNAEKFASEVEDEGYESYIGWNSKKQWNTVGVKFNYADADEKEDMLKILQEKYDESAWILRD